MGRLAFVAADCTIAWRDQTKSKLVALVDTGAGRSWIDAEYAPKCSPDEFEIPARAAFGEQTSHVGYRGNVLLGDAISIETILVAGDLAKRHNGINMLIGLDILSHGRLDIDYAGRCVTFSVPHPSGPR